jgi:hypothetical protein
MVCIPKSYSEIGAVRPLHDYEREYRDPDNACMFTYRRMVSWDDCPHLQTEAKKIERMNILRRYGANSAFAKSMLYGQFQRAEDFSLIYTDDDIELMRQAMQGKFNPVGGDVRAASDTSGGGDKQPLMVRIGTRIVLQEGAECKTGIEHAEHLVGRLIDLGIPAWQFTIDGGGLGAEVANYMEKRLDYSGIKRAQANSGPRFKFEYRDKYTETHFLLKELLSAGVLRLAWNENLLKQMRSRRFVEMEAGLKIKCEAKPLHRQREKSSPDELDTLVYLFYDFDWSLIANYAPGEQRVPSEHAPTKLEKEAEQGSGGNRVFRGMRDAGFMRERIESDRIMHTLKIGR